MSAPAPGPRREAAAVALISLLGAVVRLWRVDRLGLVHFDEGVYALAGLWVTDRAGLAALDPSVIPYAPGGFPLLVGVANLLFGIGDTAALLVPILLGIATVPLAGWLGRRSFGPGAGAAAAALAALSGPHVAFSRMALVDVPFTLAWLLALAAGGWFLTRPTAVRAVVLGAAVGLAQDVKYNGILAGVAVAVALVPLLRWPSNPGPLRPVSTLALGALAFGVAGLVYLPWVKFVQDHGGYQALLDHQRGYFDGWSAWPRNWALQLRQQAALAGRLAGPLGWTVLAVPLALLAARFARQVRGGTGALPGPARVGLGVVMLVLALVPDAVSIVALGVAIAALRAGAPTARVVAAAALVFAVMTPLYHPYARLWLPLHAASWVLVGGLIARGLDPAAWRHAAAAVADPARPRWAMIPLGALAGLVAAIGLGPAAAVPPLPGLLDPSDGLRTATAAIAARELGPGTREIRAAVRPAVIFYLVTGPTPVRVPIRRVADPAALATAAPGARNLLDTALLPPDPAAAADPVAGLAERVIRSGEPTRLNLPTLLDLDPGAARAADRERHEADRLRHLGPTHR